MDIYVVIDQDVSCPGVVLGAATGLDAAYEIANRADIWPDGVDPGWIVDLDTGVHSRRWAGVWQEIVRVPLPGALPVHPPLIDESTPLLARKPVTEGQAVRYGVDVDAMLQSPDRVRERIEEIEAIGRDFGAP